MDQFLVFRIENKLFALSLAHVIRVFRMVFVSPIPDAPDYLAGIIDWAGTVVPVIDLGVFIGLPKKPQQLSDRLLLARSGEQTLALIADEVMAILPGEADIASLPPLPLRPCTPLAGILQRDGDLIQVLDLLRIAPAPEELIQQARSIL